LPELFHAHTRRFGTTIRGRRSNQTAAAAGAFLAERHEQARIAPSATPTRPSALASSRIVE